jgi:acetyl-CoA carboxylase carboxyl transferase subunit beta
LNWLTSFVRPTIRSFVRKRDIPENLWDKCPGCEKMIFHRNLAANLHVCPLCDHHLRLGVRERLASLFDRGEYEPIDVPEVAPDPLKFRDSKRYAERLKEYRAKTGEDEAFVVAAGAMGRMPVVIAAQNFAFAGGSLSVAGGEAMVAAAREAVERRAPLITVCASGGARMQEGILSLMQMPRTTVAVDTVREAGLPYVVVLTDPTTGGVTASFAMLGDVAVAEPGALIAFTGPRVIENTIKEKLPEGFQRAEYLLEHGMVDMVVHRRELRDTLIRLLDLFMRPEAKAGREPQEGPLAIPPPPSSGNLGEANTDSIEHDVDGGMKRAAE